ncbi:MAG TPA: hypothetical protein VKF83_03445 [Stellaceae bacterium]|nr:hypothetical protein [Stellaceae bacterium]
MIRIAFLAPLALSVVLGACVTPDDVLATPEDTWTWQVNQNYQWLAHCVTDSLNEAPVHSWFYLALRPITSFEQQWWQNRIVLKSIDPQGVEQVRIAVAGVDEYSTRVVANAKNLEALGGGAPMVYVRAYVDNCARA